MKTFPWKELVQKHPLFATIRDEKTLDQLLDAEASTERVFAKDQVILRQGEVGDSLFLIGAGSVEVLLEAGEGTSLPLADLRRGEVFGEMAFLERRPRSATVRATEPTTVLELHGRQFEDIMDHYPDIEFRLLLKMSERLRTTNEQALGLQVRSIDEKLSLFDTKLDAQNKIVEVSLKAAQTVFDQTKLRADEVIFSAERARDRLNKAAVAMGSVIAVVTALLGLFGLKQVWDVKLYADTAQEASKHALAQGTLAEDARKAAEAARRVAEQVTAEVTESTKKVRDAAETSQRILVEGMLRPGLHRALREPSARDATYFYDRLVELGEPRLNLREVLESGLSTGTEFKRDKDGADPYVEVLRKLGRDAAEPKDRVWAHYLLLAYGILIDLRDPEQGQTRQTSLADLRKYVVQNPRERRLIREEVERLESRFKREPEPKRREFQAVVEAVTTP